MKLVQHIAIGFLFVSLFNLNVSSCAFAQGNPVQTTTVARIPMAKNSPHGTTEIVNLPLPIRTFDITGYVSVNAKGEIAIVEYRALLNSSGKFIVDSKGDGRIWNRIVLFDSTGKQTQNIPLPARAEDNISQILLCGDGSIWLNLTTRHYGYAIQKIDRTGKVLFEFGQSLNRKGSRQVSASLRSKWTKLYHHRWGKKYELDSVDDILTDDEGRVYLIIEDQSLHIFSPAGKPVVAYALQRGDVGQIISQDYYTIGDGRRKAFHGRLQFIDHAGQIYTSDFVLNKSNTDIVGYDIYRWNWLKDMKSELLGTVKDAGCVVGTDDRGNVYYSTFPKHVVLRIAPGGVVTEVFNPVQHYAKWIADERKKWLAGMSPSAYKRTLPYLAKHYNMGPRVGHICKVDASGRLYVTLVGAKEFRVDRITLGQ
ncbi:MAG: hypothetical protein ABJA67_06020 [Chthonomonadales bacterium]